MALRTKIISTSFTLITAVYSCCIIAQEDCYSDACLPCGKVITNLPMPSFDGNQVQPYQNFLATTQGCCLSYSKSGLYLGTGFGYGAVDYNLKVPGILLPNSSNHNSTSYVIEYLTIGYAHVINRFFIAGELGYYYHSVTSPIFYEDTSFISTEIILAEEIGAVINVTPCSVRLDINSPNHVVFDLMPGLALGQQLSLYGRLGLEYSGYTWRRRLCFPTVTGNVLIIDPESFIALDQEFGDSDTDSVIDFRLGLGVSFALNPHFSFNLDFVHIFGSRASFSPDTTSLAANAPVFIQTFTGLPIEGTITSNLNTLVATNTIDTDRNEVLFGVRFTF